MRVHLCVAALALSMAILSPAGTDEPDAPPLAPAATPQVPPLDEMLHRYLIDQALQHFEARRKRSPPSKRPPISPADKNTFATFLLRSLGDLPERRP